MLCYSWLLLSDLTVYATGEAMEEEVEKKKGEIETNETNPVRTETIIQTFFFLPWETNQISLHHFLEKKEGPGSIPWGDVFSFLRSSRLLPFSSPFSDFTFFGSDRRSLIRV